MAVISIVPNQAKAGAQARSAAGKPAGEQSSLRSRTEQPGDEITLADFNTLVLTYQDAAYNFACYLTSDPDLAEDVTQKAFINAYLNIHQFHGASFRSWLFKIIRNVAYDEFRRPSYRKDTSLDALENESGWRGLSAETQDPQNTVEAHERDGQLQRAIARIDEPYRSILILVDIHEMDYQEAAQVAGVPVGTVKSRLARARQHLRAAVESVGGVR